MDDDMNASKQAVAQFERSYIVPTKSPEQDNNVTNTYIV